MSRHSLYFGPKHTLIVIATVVIMTINEYKNSTELQIISWLLPILNCFFNVLWNKDVSTTKTDRSS